MCVLCFFFFKQKTAYEMLISDWSSDVCSSDLNLLPGIYSQLLLQIAACRGPRLAVVRIYRPRCPNGKPGPRNILHQWGYLARTAPGTASHRQNSKYFYPVRYPKASDEALLPCGVYHHQFPELLPSHHDQAQG